MLLNYREILPADFDASSRVWIYQSNRPFTLSEAFQIENLLKTFVFSWNSHGAPVKGYGHLFFGQFVILMVDEKASQISGCSTDSSVRLMKQIEIQFNVQLFDRQQIAFFILDKVQLLPLSKLDLAAAQGLLNAETLYFNNTVLNKAELEMSWIIPVKESWLTTRISFPVEVR